MTEQELRARIEEELSQYGSILLAWKSWGTVAVERVHDSKIEALDRILSFIKEALPELAKEAGYVKLAKDQHTSKID